MAASSTTSSVNGLSSERLMIPRVMSRASLDCTAPDEMSFSVVYAMSSRTFDTSSSCPSSVPYFDSTIPRACSSISLREKMRTPVAARYDSMIVLASLS